MSSAQDRWVLAATVVAESAWVFAIFGLVGALFLTSGAPMGWPAALAILGSSVVVSRVLQSINVPDVVGYAVEMGLGALVVYLTVASQVTGTLMSLDLGWIGRLGSVPETEGYLFRAFVGSVMAVGLWVRGGALASSEGPTETLRTSFRVGFVAIGVAVISGRDPNIFPITFIFIASSLAGLGIGGLHPAFSQRLQNRSWPRTIGSLVSAMVIIGVVFALLESVLRTVISRGAQSTGGLLLDRVVTPLAIAITYPVIAVMTFIFSLFGDPDTARFGDMGDASARFEGGVLSGDTGVSGRPMLFDVLVWAVVAVVIAIALYFIASSLSRRVRRRPPDVQGPRGSVVGDPEPTGGLTNLLFGLLPASLRKRWSMRPYKLPGAEPLVVEALRIYYGILTLAEARGVRREPSETPAELEKRLGSMFPQQLVRMATAAFERACYGDRAPSEAQIAEMRAGLEELEQSARPTAGHPG